MSSQQCPNCLESRPYDGPGRPSNSKRICDACRAVLACPRCGSRDFSETIYQGTVQQCLDGLARGPFCLPCSTVFGLVRMRDTTEGD